MLSNTKPIFEFAKQKNIAVCAFNVSNLETMQAVVESAIKLNTPIIISASESAIKYAGLDNLVSIAKNLTRNTSFPIALHLDHGKSFEICKECIKAGFTSVMIDGSSLPFDENVKLTKKVVDFAHKHNITVEAELGKIMGVEDNVSSVNSILTDPFEAKQFVNLTNCDSLAISIGTAHGINKGIKQPKIYYNTISNVSNALGNNYPLVAHGSSSVPQEFVTTINKNGGCITKSQGISKQDLIKMSKTAICKINIDTDLRLAFTSGLREYLNNNKDQFDPRKILGYAKDKVKNYVEETIKMLSM